MNTATPNDTKWLRVPEHHVYRRSIFCDTQIAVCASRLDALLVAQAIDQRHGTAHDCINGDATATVVKQVDTHVADTHENRMKLLTRGFTFTPRDDEPIAVPTIDEVPYTVQTYLGAIYANGGAITLLVARTAYDPEVIRIANALELTTGLPRTDTQEGQWSLTERGLAFLKSLDAGNRDRMQKAIEASAAAAQGGN